MSSNDLRDNIMRESLFDKFEINPGSQQSELMKSFQTTPSLRKELPLYVKTLKDPKSLYWEALISTRVGSNSFGFKQALDATSIESLSVAESLAASNDFLKHFDDHLHDSKNDWELFAGLCSKFLEGNSLDSVSPCSKFDVDGRVEEGFKAAFIDEVSKKCVSVISMMDGDIFWKLHATLTSEVVPARMRASIDKAMVSECSIVLETLPQRFSDSGVTSNGIKFVVDVAIPLCAREELYPSYKYLCNKLFGQLPEMFEMLMPHALEMLKSLNEPDRESVVEKIASWYAGIVDPANAEANTYQLVSFAGKFAVKIKVTSEKCIDSVWMFEAVLSLANMGKENYEKFRSGLSAVALKTNLPENMLWICQTIHDNPALAECSIFYANSLGRVSGFEEELSRMTTRMEVYNDAIGQAKKSIENATQYDYLYNRVPCTYGGWKRFISSAIDSNDILTVSNIESFIYKYYALTILNGDLIVFFKSIVRIYFNLISVVAVIPSNEFIRCSMGINPKGQFMKDFLLDTPGNWWIEDEDETHSVNWYLRKLFHTEATKTSVMNAYMQRCDEARARKPKQVYAYQQASSTSGCYVATAVYGSYDCAEVWTLRRFRDYRLSKSICGRAFIRAYYFVSPTFVKVFGGNKIIKGCLKLPLDRLVAKCREEGFSSAPYDDPIW